MRSEVRDVEAWPKAVVKSCAALMAFTLGVLAAAWSQGDARASTAGLFGSRTLLPRFESLKSDSVSLRNGPGTTYPISWVLRRIGLPVEVVREESGWRQVRDADGTTGWAPAHLLSGRRTALVVGPNYRPGATQLPLVDLYDRPGPTAKVTVRLEAGALVSVSNCDGTWCRVALDERQGFAPQQNLWGVYLGEKVR